MEPFFRDSVDRLFCGGAELSSQVQGSQVAIFVLSPQNQLLRYTSSPDILYRLKESPAEAVDTQQLLKRRRLDADTSNGLHPRKKSCASNGTTMLLGPTGQLLHVSGVKHAGFLDRSHLGLVRECEQEREFVDAELDRLSLLGAGSKPRDGIQGMLVPVQGVAGSHTGRDEDEGGDQGPGPGGKGKRFKPLSIMVPDCGTAAAPGATAQQKAATSLPGTSGSGLQGVSEWQAPTASTSQPANPPQSTRTSANGGVLGAFVPPEGLALPSPAISPLTYGQDNLDISSFLLSARGPGHLSDLKGGSLWSPSSGSTGMGAGPRSGHLGGFSDDTEGDEAGGGATLGGEGLMVMGRSLSRAALCNAEHQDREAGAGPPQGPSGPSGQQQSSHDHQQQHQQQQQQQPQSSHEQQQQQQQQQQPPSSHEHQQASNGQQQQQQQQQSGSQNTQEAGGTQEGSEGRQQHDSGRKGSTEGAQPMEIPLDL